MLRDQAYDVCVAADADGAWAAIRNCTPAAIVLDLHLPGIEGVEFLRRLRAVCGLGSMPVAVVTGDYLIDDRVTEEIQALGARLYFKPLWAEDLAQIVGALLKSHPISSTSTGGSATIRPTDSTITIT